MKDIYDFVKSFDLHTIIVVGIAFYFLNGNITKLQDEVKEIQSDLRVIRTCLIMKNIMPSEVAKNGQK